MESPTEESFEYTNLDEQTRTIIWQYTAEIKDLMRLTAENIISIGRKLTQVKLQLGYGSFQKWLRTEFEWSEQTARQFMQVYRWSETIENKKLVFSKLGTSALYLLAAPSTPPEARKEVLDLVDGGAKVSYTRAKHIINHYRKLPLAVDDKVTKIVETEIQPNTQAQIDEIDNLLFRLETSKLGCIVKLYQAAELKVITNLTVGAIVEIDIGRWQGQKAKIIEVLNEQQLSIVDCQQTSSRLAALRSPAMDIGVYIIDEADFGDRRKLREADRCLTVGYKNVCLAITTNSATLAAFIKQIEVDPEFIKDIFQQALDRQNSSTQA